jgi:hypothetical protein
MSDLHIAIQELLDEGIKPLSVCNILGVSIEDVIAVLEDMETV